MNQNRKYIDFNELNLSLYGSSVPIETEQKKIGLLIDNSLTWNLHINNVYNKLSSLIGLLYKMHTFLDFSSKVLFYNSYILPRIYYCLSICGDAPIDTLLRLFRLQKRVARLILDVENDTSSAIFLES